jgi:uncharacterized protein YbdZ (MbtH family)
MEAAHLASATAQEITDDEARLLVGEWWRQFDAIPKGWKKQSEYHRDPPGYPEPAWSELRAASDAAQKRLGQVLRDLLV